MRILLISLAALIALSSCGSKYGTIQGSVSNYLTHKPLPGALVQIAGTSDTVRSDPSGRYVFTAAVPGPQKISVSKPGYIAPAPTEITVAKGTTTTASVFSLLPQPEESGLYAVRRDSLVAIPRVTPPYAWYDPAHALYRVNVTQWGKPKPISTPMTLLFYAGASSPKGTLSIHTMSPTMGGDVSTVTQSAMSNGLTIESPAPGISLFTGTLPTDQWFAVLFEPSGEEAWVYEFAPSAPSQ